MRVIARLSALLLLAGACETADQSTGVASAIATPTGAHAKHDRFACSTCHLCGGLVYFDPAGPAVAPSRPLPGFDTTAKTCSSVACHGLYSGTFYYTFYEEPRSWTYAGNGGATPPWNSTGLGCTACHGNPPPPLSWHGRHGTFPGANDCQLCHPDAVGVNGVGTGLSTATNCGPTGTTPCASLHGDGNIDVAPRWRSSPCLNCH